MTRISSHKHAGKTISASFQDLPVALALKKMLEGTGINYAVLGAEDGEPESIFIGGSSAPGAAHGTLTIDRSPAGAS